MFWGEKLREESKFITRYRTMEREWREERRRLDAEKAEIVKRLTPGRDVGTERCVVMVEEMMKRLRAERSSDGKAEGFAEREDEG